MKLNFSFLQKEMRLRVSSVSIVTWLRARRPGARYTAVVMMGLLL